MKKKMVEYRGSSKEEIVALVELVQLGMVGDTGRCVVFVSEPNMTCWSIVQDKGRCVATGFRVYEFYAETRDKTTHLYVVHHTDPAIGWQYGISTEMSWWIWKTDQGMWLKDALNAVATEMPWPYIKTLAKGGSLADAVLSTGGGK